MNDMKIPTDAYVRKVYARAPVTTCEHDNQSPDYAAEQFDLWLAARDAAIRADIAAEVLAPIEALIETDGVFLKKDTKIKRVQEDRRRDLGAIVTTSMVTVDDIRAALSTAKEASE